MARLRKASRYWRDDAVRAARVAMVRDDGSIFAIDPAAIFGRRAPLEVEIGAGRGDFIIARAKARPERDFLAVERPGIVGQMLAARCGRTGLGNLRVAAMDGRTLVNLLLAEKSVGAFHIYFPDPWPKERHAKHRLFSPFFVASLARTLERGGLVYVATDVEQRASEIFAMLEGGGFRRLEENALGARSSPFGRKYLARGIRVFAATFAAPPAAPAGGP
jgi:tRNA (guanine-N(7)-)-methyltransferase